MTASFIPGRVVGGRYELLSKLGQGGVGSVWLAKDRTLGITVAVKELLHEVSKDRLVLEKFMREGELSARMLSPNIVKVLARGVDDATDTPHIVYELLEGEDLQQRLDREENIDFADTETITVHVARALSRAHGVGVIHRDIKPANVFITRDEDGRVLAKVLDFGVAELMASAGANQSLSGTLEYMAPEVLIDGKPPDVRTDLYALAVLAYRCLTGRLPFDGQTLAQVMVAIDATTPPKISKCLGTEPLPELDAWFEIGLAREPTYRFTTARELAETLHTAIKEAKRLAPEVSSPAPLTPQRSTTTDTFEQAPPKVSVRPKLRMLSTPPPPPLPRPRPKAPPPPPPMRARAASFVFEEDEPLQTPQPPKKEATKPEAPKAPARAGSRPDPREAFRPEPGTGRGKLPSVVEVDATRKSNKDDRRH